MCLGPGSWESILGYQGTKPKEELDDDHHYENESKIKLNEAESKYS